MMKKQTKDMKKIFLTSCLALGLCACHNFDTDFPDFEYTTGYFPYQFPERVLVLGDYIYDNSNDNAHKFVISVAMGGVYRNKQDRRFSFVVDESLCDGIRFSSKGTDIKALPKSYYSLSNDHEIVIPKGKFNGGIEVQLTDAFFQDPDAVKNTYVVPLRLTGSNDVDSLLVGQTSVPNADVRDKGQWAIAPKHFTLFGIKYINEWHGNYLHYGKSSVTDGAGARIESTEYSAQYLEQNDVYRLTTTARNQVSLTTHLKGELFPKEVTMLFDFNGDDCTITSPEGSPYTVKGSGTFKKGAYSFGNKSRNGIAYSFTCTDGKNTYKAEDVLVARDRAVTLETYTPVLK